MQSMYIIRRRRNGEPAVADQWPLASTAQIDAALPSEQINRLPQSLGLRGPAHRLRSRQILRRHTQRFVDRDLLIALPPNDITGDYLADFACDLALADRIALDRR